MKEKAAVLLKVCPRDGLAPGTIRIRASVQHLPEQILAHAQLLEREGNPDAAAENYILYLNSTPSLPTPERTQAEAFLFQQFNIHQKYAASF